MKHPKINGRQPAKAEPVVAQLTLQPNPPLERWVHTVTVSIGVSRYEMIWHWEIREITKGPAHVIEMPGPSAGGISEKTGDSRACRIAK